MAIARSHDNLIETLLLLGGLGYLGARYVLPGLGVTLELPKSLGLPNLLPATNTAAPGPASAPRGIRNNNPGNLRWSILNPWTGQSGKDAQGYAQFSSPDYGIRAALKLLRNYITLNGLQTIKAISARWAPAGDGTNNPAVWSSNVAIYSGIGQNAQLNPNNQAQMLALMRGVIGQENGKAWVSYYNGGALTRAWGLL